MEVETQEVVKNISVLLDDLEALSLTKEEEWKGFQHKIKELLPKLAQGFQAPFLLIERCLEEGFSILTSSQKMSLIEHLMALMEEVKEAILEQRAPQSQGIEEELQKLLPSLGIPLEEGPDINSIAEFIIKAEPEDPNTLKELLDVLEQFVNKGALRPQEKASLEQAYEDLRSSMEEGPEEIKEALKRLGELVETISYGGEVVEEKVEPPKPQEPQEKIEVRTYSEADFQLPEDAEPDLLSDFVSESGDLIAAAEEALLALEADPGDMDAVGKVFRAFHTVKGTSAFLGLQPISELAHKAENLLSRVRDGEIKYEGGYADLSLKALDMIKELIAQVRGALEGKPIRKPDGFDSLLEVLKNPEAHGISEKSGIAEEFIPRVGDILVAKGVVDREQVEMLSKVEDGKPIGKRLVEYGMADVKDVAEALRVQRKIKAEPEMDITVRVSTQRLDRLIDMVGELVIAHSMVAQDEVVTTGHHLDLQRKVSHTSKIVRELQDISMSMRMVPLKATFNKMQRLVRDLSKKMAKKVQLITEGEDTEIDRNMVDIINDPLVHMIRNAVDHGIETPGERIQKGKPEVGTILLSAYHSSGNVVVEIRDDGKGLDKEAILKKAKEKGLIKEGAILSEKEIFSLIFEPGFSTATVVSDVSGRGVGMDVVKKNIEKLRGQVEVLSRPNEGTTFKLSLPLTLAIIDGMVVKVGKERYVIPTASILRAVKPKEEELSSVLKDGKMIKLQDELIPVFRLADIFGIRDAKQSFTECLAVIVQDESQTVAILVDELIGRQQIVIKSLGEGLKHVSAISGGAIMPDGGVGLILDVAGIIRLANS